MFLFNTLIRDIIWIAIFFPPCIIYIEASWYIVLSFVRLYNMFVLMYSSLSLSLTLSLARPFSITLSLAHPLIGLSSLIHSLSLFIFIKNQQRLENLEWGGSYAFCLTSFFANQVEPQSVATPRVRSTVSITILF